MAVARSVSASRARSPHAYAGTAQAIAQWQRQAGRHDLPWQATRDPYRIWLSEIMLQQTQAATVIPYYQRFIEAFPTILDLASAPSDAVMHAWAGLGYYARARNLHRCAQQVRDTYAGIFPDDPEVLAQLPGIGPSTAAAIAAFAFGARRAILDGNVRRVLSRYFALDGDPGSAPMIRELWTHAHALLEAAPDDLDMRAYTQGQMDLGATLCTRHQPACERCPIAANCLAYQQGRQNALPAPRARRVRPERDTLMLIIECQGRILLHKRPSRGIWGGLWSLPQFDTQAELWSTCAQRAPDAGPPVALAGFHHDFTHFRLRITPWRMRCYGAVAADAAEAWVPVNELSDRALPSPVARLLAGLYP
ncbi:MAG TPA: A/G-specific adenine glycosylase [Castellaniella sp.]|nr:A/G-specific adenine glycosylase [Castellaniella sp.]